MISSILSKSQLHEVIINNRYKLDNDSLSSNLDELMLLNKTAVEFGFEVDKKKAAKLIEESLKGQKNSIYLKEKYVGAVLQIRGEYSVKSEFSLGTAEGFLKGELFIFHETSINKFHKLLAEKLIDEKTVKLFPGCDEEYLYEAISEVTETYLYETLRKLAPGLPVFQVIFDAGGSFDIKEMGKINNSE